MKIECNDVEIVNVILSESTVGINCVPKWSLDVEKIKFHNSYDQASDEYYVEGSGTSTDTGMFTNKLW